MEYIVIKENGIDRDICEISRINYIVRIKNPILHYFFDFFGFDYKCFSSKEEAIKCAKLKSIGKWDYTISKEKVYESQT